MHRCGLRSERPKGSGRAERPHDDDFTFIARPEIPGGDCLGLLPYRIPPGAAGGQPADV